MTKKAAFAAGVLSCLSALHAADASGTWTSAAQPTSLAGGAVTFTYAGDAITSVAATPANGGTIYLDGDEMPLAAGATVRVLAPGRLVISNAVTCVGDLSASGCGTLTRGWHDGLASTLSDATQALLPSNAFVTMFQNMDLDEWEPVAFYGSRSENQPNAKLDPAGAAGWNVSEGYDLLAGYVRRETVGGEKRLEVQLFHRGSYVCDAVKVLLKQDGANVAGKLLGAWRGGKNAHADETIEEALMMPPCVSFNSSTNDFAVFDAAVPGHVAGLGVAQLTMRRIVPEAVLEFAGKLTVPTASKVAGAENLGIEGHIGTVTTDNGGSAASVRSPNFQVNGTLRIVDNVGSNGCLHGKLSGTGDVWLKGAADVASSTTNSVFTDYYYNYSIPATRTNDVASFSRYPFDITNATALCVGNIDGNGMWNKFVYATCFNMKKDGDDPSDLIRIGQYQTIFNGSILCAYVRFFNNGANLRANYLSAWSVPNEPPYSLGMDFDSVTNTATSVTLNASGVNANGLGLRDTTYSFAHPRAGYIQMKDSTAFWNTMSGSPWFIIEGTDTRSQVFVASCSNALPSCGTVDVRNGGWLQLRARAIDKTGYNGGGAKIVVRKGGRLWTHERYPFADKQKIFLDGGELRLGVGLGQNTILSWPYVEYLVMKDGARVCGNRLVTGNRALDPYITVCGSEPSTFDSTLTLQATQTPSAARHFQWRVADVTGDAAADLVMNGDINCYNSVSTNTAMHKYGDGTILMNGQCCQYGKTLIYEGAWEFGPTGDANGRTFVLRGGTLAAADGTENEFAALEVGEEGGTIKIGAGARLAFAAGAEAAWVGTVVIDTGSDVLPPDALRFGEDAHGLSRAQMRKLRFNGCAVHLTSAGYVTDSPTGLTIVIE